LTEAPALIKEGLQEQQVEENSNATLSCRLSKTAKTIKWSKDGKLLRAGKRYKIQLEGDVASLEIRDVESGDAGTYECATGEDKTSAPLRVKGNYCDDETFIQFFLNW